MVTQAESRLGGAKPAARGTAKYTPELQQETAAGAIR
jgi:hypothetical protein